MAKEVLQSHSNRAHLVHFGLVRIVYKSSQELSLRQTHYGSSHVALQHG